MAYKVNGVDLTLQPGSGRWRAQDKLGDDGNNRPIYEPTRTFEMGFPTISQDEFKQLYDFWFATSSTGSVIVDLPQYPATSYIFNSYTGCVLEQPEVSEYFEGYILNARMVVRNVRT